MKEMTASEILRDCARRSSRPELAAAEYYFHEAYVDDYTCDLCSLFRAIADKIDAELSQARELSLRAGAELWAKDNGWPDFRDGEDFGAWLDRCFIPRPRFEDGEPVQFGELVSSNLFGAVKVSAIEFTEDGTHVKDEPDGDWSTSLEVTTSRLKRPAPEVLGADGLPIKSGEIVWLTDEGNAHVGSLDFKAGPMSCGLLGVGVGEPLTVLEIKPNVGGNDHRFVVFDHHSGPWCDASWLTHTPPDTQDRIDEDATMPPREYYAEHIGHDVGLKDDEEVVVAMTRDLLRRQRRLDEVSK